MLLYQGLYLLSAFDLPPRFRTKADVGEKYGISDRTLEKADSEMRKGEEVEIALRAVKDLRKDEARNSDAVLPPYPIDGPCFVGRHFNDLVDVDPPPNFEPAFNEQITSFEIFCGFGNWTRSMSESAFVKRARCLDFKKIRGGWTKNKIVQDFLSISDKIYKDIANSRILFFAPECFTISNMAKAFHGRDWTKNEGYGTSLDAAHWNTYWLKIVKLIELGLRASEGKRHRQLWVVEGPPGLKDTWFGHRLQALGGEPVKISWCAFSEASSKKKPKHKPTLLYTNSELLKELAQGRFCSRGAHGNGCDFRPRARGKCHEPVKGNTNTCAYPMALCIFIANALIVQCLIDNGNLAL